ncbi:hypothetical protein KQX54_007166 [Cotesia glomerata]|uniref:Uncharacterized protein n=1 Tax=Cotesia glomerata TaxID=32391 RepID=A0AAV7J7E6_COTGL|nr:hypothetical protein KQX54_007166 [Cotesia glomerata]
MRVRCECGVILYSITELESRSLALLPAQHRVDIEGLRVNRSDSTVVGNEPRKGKGMQARRDGGPVANQPSSAKGCEQERLRKERTF